MSYELRIIRRLLEIGKSSKHSLDADVSSDGRISIYVHDSRAEQAVIDSFYVYEHEDERDVFEWLADWADTIREEREHDTD